MTKSKKILAGTLLALLPLAAFAGDRHHDCKNSAMSKGANYEFEGKVEQRPTNGFNGVWKISGIEVIVDDSTFIEQKEKSIKVGHEVEILAKRENGKITAIELEQE